VDSENKNVIFKNKQKGIKLFAVMKTKVLQFYHDNIKPYSDKIPYFRELARIVWRVIWKLRLTLKSIWLSVDLEKIYWINPQKIIYGLESNELMVSKYKYKGKKPYRYGGFTSNIIKFEDKLIYRSFYDHFIEGKQWKETGFYKRVINMIKDGKCIWCCSSVSEYNRRCEKLDKLYYTIKKNGIEVQQRLRETALLKENMIKEIANEIIVYIGPEGELIHRNGQHRLTISKILNIDKVPIQILYRDKKWIEFRKEILAYIRREMNGKAFQPIPHPDLSDIPSLWSDRRFKMIMQNLTTKKGMLLDIGAHWGYFCHKFEEMGFQCTAMEDSPKNLYFLRKLKRAGYADFQIINKSIFDYKDYEHGEDGLNFDIVLALNIFNQFVDMEKNDLYLKLIELFRKLKAKEMYFQVPNELEGMQQAQLKVKYGNKNRDYSSQEFINLIIKGSNFTNVERIGEDRNCGIYKLC
jgi:hypothetical protein